MSVRLTGDGRAGLRSNSWPGSMQPVSIRCRNGTRPVVSGSTRYDRRSLPTARRPEQSRQTTDCVLDLNRDSRSRQRAGQPARLATRRTPRCAATSCNFLDWRRKIGRTIAVSGVFPSGVASSRPEFLAAQRLRPDPPISWTFRWSRRSRRTWAEGHGAEGHAQQGAEGRSRRGAEGHAQHSGQAGEGAEGHAQHSGPEPPRDLNHPEERSQSPRRTETWSCPSG